MFRLLALAATASAFMAPSVSRPTSVAMPAKVDDILEDIKSLTLVEASELVSKIEETFGVDASAVKAALLAKHRAAMALLAETMAARCGAKADTLSAAYAAILANMSVPMTNVEAIKDVEDYMDQLSMNLAPLTADAKALADDWGALDSFFYLADGALVAANLEVQAWPGKIGAAVAGNHETIADLRQALVDTEQQLSDVLAGQTSLHQNQLQEMLARTDEAKATAKWSKRRREMTVTVVAAVAATATVLAAIDRKSVV